MEAFSTTRRRALKYAGGAIVAVGGGSALAGCSDSQDGAEQNNTDNNAKVKLPAYVPYRGVQPDLPGSADGVLDAFLKYPASPAAVTEGVPGKGKEITALLELGTAPSGVDRNQYWQELNKRLGADLKLNGVPAAQYAAKLATTLAGGDIPDFVQIQPQPHLSDLLAARFTDLTEFLSGDAVKKYPSLANIPTASWKPVVFNGGIYGVPYPQGAMSTIVITREDIFDERGATSDVKSAEEFLEVCKKLTDTKKNRWALGNATPPGILHFVQQMYGAPNIWSEKDGKFTNWYEVEATKQALEFTIRLWKEGVFHPDSFTGSTQLSRWFAAGTIAMMYGSYSNWSGFLTSAKESSPNARLGAMAPPKAEGGGLARKFTNTRVYTFTALKKADKARTEELLQVMNWLAAPFGTQEYRFRKYGIEGTHHTLNGTDPVLTQVGKDQVNLPLAYIANNAPILYEPGAPDQTKIQYELQQKMVPGSVEIASVGLTSEADATKTAGLDKKMRDLQAEVIQGRKSMADWDAGVVQWRKDGGDEIRREFEAAFAKAN